MPSDLPTPSYAHDTSRLGRRSRLRRTDLPAWRRTPLRLGLSLVGALLIVLLLDLVWAAYTVARDLATARDDLLAGATELVAGDVEGATSRFASAAGAADAADSFDVHPSIHVLGVIPTLQDDVDAVIQLTTVAQLSATGARLLADAARATGWDGSSTPAFATGGTIDLDAIEEALPGLEDARAKFVAAQAELDSVDTTGLIDSLQSRFVTGRASLDQGTSMVTKAADVAELLPAMFGGHHRYLLELTNLSAPRGTGGYLGIYGVLDAVDGQLRLEPLEDTGDIAPLKDPVDAPADVADRYDRFGTRRVFWASNYSPDFPTSSRVGLEIADTAGLGHLDGVISLDSIFTSYILGAIGPVDSAAWPEPIAAENVVTIMNHDTFTLPNESKSNEVQRAIGGDIVKAIFERQPALQPFSSAISLSIAERHLQVYVRDPRSEALIERLGADGGFELGPNPLAVVFQDYVASRTGYFVDKQIDSSVTLDADGSAATETTVTIRNSAPTDPPSVLLGDGSDGVPIGYAAMLANTYLPQDAQDIRLTSKDAGVFVEEEEFDHPVSFGLLEAEAGTDAALTTTYTRADAVTSVDGVTEYRISFQPQPSLRPVTLSVHIQLPQGAMVTTVGPGMLVEGQTAIYSGQPTTALTLWVRYRSMP